jgi:hypothetical protein
MSSSFLKKLEEDKKKGNKHYELKLIIDQDMKEAPGEEDEDMEDEEVKDSIKE